MESINPILKLLCSWLVNSPWGGILLVLACTRCALALTQFAGRRRHLGPETVRKFLHALVGVIFCLSPWLFHDVWPLAMAMGLLAILLLLRHRIEYFRRHVEDILDGIERRSAGDFCYAAGICLLFLISRGNPLLFCAPLLILSLADAAAAVVGVRFGTTRYPTISGTKSVEGSITFCAAAFAIIFVGIVCATSLHWTAAMLIGLESAAVLGVVEALAFGGLDNLLLPLAAYWLLKTMMSVSAYHLQLGACMLSAAILLAALRPWRRLRAASSAVARPEWRRHENYQTAPRAAGTAAGGLPDASPAQEAAYVKSLIESAFEHPS